MVEMKLKIDTLKAVGSQCFLTLAGGMFFSIYFLHSSFLFFSLIYCYKIEKQLILSSFLHCQLTASIYKQNARFMYMIGFIY